MSGNSCLNFLRSKNCVKIFDDNPLLNDKKENNIFLKKDNVIKSKFDLIVFITCIDIQKCSLKNYLKKNWNNIITELDIFQKSYPKNTKITITGTNGKSTTCQMLYDILRIKKKDVRLVGNIGNSPLQE